MDRKDFEKAKTIIQTKHFCFMEWQEKDVLERGGKVMDKEDMNFLLSFEISRPKLLHHDMEQYDSEGLYTAIEKAKSQQLDGVLLLMSPIINDDVLKIEAMGHFVEFLGPGDIGDEIYFTEDGLTTNRIFDFKSLFDGVATMVETRII